MRPTSHPWPTRKHPETGRYEVCVEGKWVSRQRAWQLIRVVTGRCVTCGAPRDEHSNTYCRRHHLANAERNRKHGGFKVWRPDGVGRPPHVRQG